jgi:phosphomethylpyrimidine synthase
VSRRGEGAGKFEEDVLLDVIRDQAEQGVDFMTLHAGILRDHIGLAARRLGGIVSRGGSIMAVWMLEHGRENPLYERWDEVLDICSKHDVTVSLGDGLRPGCLADASDEAQFAELDVLGFLVKRCRERGVQVMVEGPGHIPFHQIKMNIEKALRVCDDAPFYVLGPVVTDVAPGYDHITASIGATAAAAYGASLLCYVTPAEHLGLPMAEEVREGVFAFRIAAHAGDVARGIPGARDWDDDMSRARASFNWARQFDLAIDSEKARDRFKQGAGLNGSDYCSMCGPDFCALKMSKKVADEVNTRHQGRNGSDKAAR